MLRAAARARRRCRSADPGRRYRRGRSIPLKAVHGKRDGHARRDGVEAQRVAHLVGLGNQLQIVQAQVRAQGAQRLVLGSAVLGVDVESALLCTSTTRLQRIGQAKQPLRSVRIVSFMILPPMRSAPAKKPVVQLLVGSAPALLTAAMPPGVPTSCRPQACGWPFMFDATQSRRLSHCGVVGHFDLAGAAHPMARRFFDPSPRPGHCGR